MAFDANVRLKSVADFVTPSRKDIRGLNINSNEVENQTTDLREGDFVSVRERNRPYKEGGCGTVTKVSKDDHGRIYVDVKYILGGTNKHVPLEFVSTHKFLQVSTSSRSRNKSAMASLSTSLSFENSAVDEDAVGSISEINKPKRCRSSTVEYKDIVEKSKVQLGANAGDIYDKVKACDGNIDRHTCKQLRQSEFITSKVESQEKCQIHTLPKNQHMSQLIQADKRKRKPCSDIQEHETMIEESPTMLTLCYIPVEPEPQKGANSALSQPIIEAEKIDIVPVRTEMTRLEQPGLSSVVEDFLIHAESGQFIAVTKEEVAIHHAIFSVAPHELGNVSFRDLALILARQSITASNLRCEPTTMKRVLYDVIIDRAHVAQSTDVEISSSPKILLRAKPILTHLKHGSRHQRKKLGRQGGLKYSLSDLIEREKTKSIHIKTTITTAPTPSNSASVPANAMVKRSERKAFAAFVGSTKPQLKSELSLLDTTESSLFFVRRWCQLDEASKSKYANIKVRRKRARHLKNEISTSSTSFSEEASLSSCSSSRSALLSAPVPITSPSLNEQASTEDIAPRDNPFKKKRKSCSARDIEIDDSEEEEEDDDDDRIDDDKDLPLTWHHLPEEIKLRVMEVVWVKYSSKDPWWPAIVYHPLGGPVQLREKSLSNIGSKHLVYFYGSENWGHVNFDCVRSFESNFDDLAQLASNGKSKKLQENQVKKRLQGINIAQDELKLKKWDRAIWLIAK